ncbi:hypothetical protein HPC37_02980 [Pasteurellaceae bacterium 20609_3]|uniref:hypothetical protein n=1 Tax=Spirabiliibacterium mucosae TaxID=28156 RepID=UPI001AACAB19|nr:hypothetical protein [Spirabiliibacterium mucosae]MBE2897818.1 hypothetical protein [Spirabiliibacterium mucosae]
MAFTSTTFNFLKQTVLDSMAEDAKNGLITGKVMKTGGFQTATFYARLISNEVTRAVFNVSKNFCPEHEPNIIEKIADVQTIDGVIYVREYGKNDKQRLGKWMNKNLELDAMHKDEIIKQTVNGVAAKVVSPRARREQLHVETSEKLRPA